MFSEDAISSQRQQSNASNASLVASGNRYSMEVLALAALRRVTGRALAIPDYALLLAAMRRR